MVIARSRGATGSNLFHFYALFGNKLPKQKVSTPTFGVSSTTTSGESLTLSLMVAFAFKKIFNKFESNSNSEKSIDTIYFND